MERLIRPFDFLARVKGLTKHQAYQLVSVAGTISQLVDRPIVGVHLKMPKSTFR